MRPFTSLTLAADEQEIEAGEDMVDIVDIRERYSIAAVLRFSTAFYLLELYGVKLSSSGSEYSETRRRKPF